MNSAPLFLIIVILPLLLGGCGEKSVNERELEKREGMTYLKGALYTGKAFTLYENGQKKEEGNYKDGKADGLKAMWYKSGQKALVANLKGGNPDGLVLQWHENGQKQGEGNFKDGVQIYVKYWNNKGEPVDSLKESMK